MNVSRRDRARRLRLIAAAVTVLLAADAAVTIEATGQAVAVTPADTQQPKAAAKDFGPAQADDLASAMLTAKLQNRRIEVLGDRTSASQTFANPDGTTTFDAFAEPRWVKRGSDWIDVDATLRQNSDGTWSPAASEARLVLSGGGSGPMASMTVDGKTLTLSWPSALPKPTVSGAVATYPDVLASGVDLQLTAAVDGGVEQTLVVKNATAAADPALQDLVTAVSANGGSVVSADAGGNLSVKDSSGREIVTSPAPVMWDSTTEPAAPAPADSPSPQSSSTAVAGGPQAAAAARVALAEFAKAKGTRSTGQAPGSRARQAKVKARLDKATRKLHLTPDQELLTSKSTVFPVFIDPAYVPHTASGSRLHYDEVQQAYPTTSNYDGSVGKGLAVGYQGFSSPTGIERTYYNLSVPSSIKGAIIQSATLNTTVSYAAASGSNSTTVNVFSTCLITSSTTWNAQPCKDSSANPNYPNPNVSKAFTTSSQTPNLAVGFDVTAAMQKLADKGANNWTLGLFNASETNSTDFVRFSANPTFSITYNHRPSKPTQVAPANAVITNDSTPTLQSTATDADNDTVTHLFQIDKTDGTTVVASGYSPYVNSGATASWTPGTALADGTYEWHSSSYDGHNWWSPNSDWTAWRTITIDTKRPGAASVSSTAFPSGAWSGTPDSSGNLSGSFTVTPPSSDVVSIAYKLDAGTWTTVATTGATVTKSLTFKAGWHTLAVHAIDAAGNTTATDTSYSFGAGQGSLTSPSTGDITDSDIALTAQQSGGFNGVTYQYRVGDLGTWQSIPLGDVKTSSGGTVSAWPLAFASSAQPEELTWAATKTFTDDGPLQVRAVFTNSGGSPYNTPASTFTINRKAENAPSSDVGPGSVNLLTGDYTLDSDDASGFGAGVSRTASSRDPLAGTEQKGQVAIFGPNWISGISGDGSDWSYVAPTSDQNAVNLVAADGSVVGFTKKSSTATTDTWAPEPGAEGLTLTDTKSGSTIASFDLSTTDGEHDTFTRTNAGEATWQLKTSYAVTGSSATSTTIVSNEVLQPDGKTYLSEPHYVIAPGAVDAGTCASAPTATKGCRVLEFTYAPGTTAADQKPGDYKGQVSSITLWATDPQTNAVTSTVLANYAYNTAGQLVSYTDPRSNLTVGYAYDSSGRVTSLTPPGQLPWTFKYDQVGSGGDSGPGMLLSVSRPTLAKGTTATVDGTATTTIAYRVPVSGGSAPYDLGSTATATWGQSDNPVTGTAVFPPSSTPSSSDGTKLAAGDYTKAGITYMDKDGFSVNTAAPGGGITTEEHDADGNTTRELTAANRALALGQTVSGDPLLAAALADAGDTAARAQLLSITTTYAPGTSGEALAQEVKGPLHTAKLQSALSGGPADLPAGAVVEVREHTSYRYDESRPSTASVSDLVTSTTVGGYVANYANDADPNLTTNTYDWSTGAQLSTVVDPNGLALTTTESYDSNGNLLSETKPDTNPTTKLVTTYWNTGSGSCQGHPEWAGLVCQTAPGATISGAGANPNELVTKAYTYDRYGNIATIAESANGSTRTTTYTYDANGRVTKQSVTGGTGTATPDVSYTYDATTGLLASTSNDSQTITRTYDKLGRQVTYYDGIGNTSTTSYDALDRPVSVTDSAPSTTTYTYDDVTGLTSSATDSVAGTVSVTGRDADGHLTGESLPSGYKLTQTFDPIGGLTRRTYADGAGTALLDDQALYTTDGSQAEHTQDSGTSTHTSYTYDAAGRLTSAQDDSGADCTTRSYDFANSRKSWNRSRLTTATSTVDCADTTSSTTTANTQDHTYDSADRLADTGYAYDAFGNTLTTPGANLTYYTNSLARSEATTSTKQTWTLDAKHRVSGTINATSTDGGNTWSSNGTTTNHYGDDSDDPTWTSELSGRITRNVLDFTGGLAATTSASGAVTLHMANIHGDIAVQLAVDSTTATASQYDEYGNATNQARYGWLGSLQRASDTPTGVTLMGSRLYDATTGRFLQSDPITGGSANQYDYANQDPVNQSDVSGQCPMCIAVAADALFILGVTLVAIGVYEYWLHYCKNTGCSITVPHAPAIPLPRWDSKTARSTKNTPYIVYEIYWETGLFGFTHHTYKYGISRAGTSRPRSQLSTCSRYAGHSCKYKVKARVTGFFKARIREALYIAMYAATHGHCPPGQLKSCR